VALQQASMSACTFVMLGFLRSACLDRYPICMHTLYYGISFYEDFVAANTIYYYIFRALVYGQGLTLSSHYRLSGIANPSFLCEHCRSAQETLSERQYSISCGKAQVLLVLSTSTTMQPSLRKLHSHTYRQPVLLNDTQNAQEAPCSSAPS